jgi:hypothetical protein
MTRSLRAQPVERDVGFHGDVAGCNEKRGEDHRGETPDGEQPAIG